MSNPGPVHVDLLSFTYQRQIRQTGGESRPNLEELCRHITPEHAVNWRRIGNRLGISYGDLNAIEQVYAGLHEICCNEMFEKWLQNTPHASWNDIFAAVGIESWYDNPDNYRKPIDADTTDVPSHSNTSTGFILGAIPRHCILHVLTVIKEAMYKDSRDFTQVHNARQTGPLISMPLAHFPIQQGNTLMLDQFIKDISELVKPESTPATKSPNSSSNQYGAFKKLDPLPVIPVRAVQQFKNKAISTVEFAKLLESRLSSTAASHFIELNYDVLQRICWKYYLTSKTATLPQHSWLNHSVCYQLFLIFNKMLGDNYSTVVTGDKVNKLLEKIAWLVQRSSELVTYNSPHMTFDFAMFLTQIIACFNNFSIPDSEVLKIIIDVYEEQVNGVLKRGYLVKKGAKRKNWKRRWFVLKSDEMSYYESGENLTLKGKIILNSESDVLSTPDEKNRLFRFIVICGSDSRRAYEIKAPTLQSKNNWLQAIRQVLNQKEPGGGGKPRSKSNPVPNSNKMPLKSTSSEGAPSTVSPGIPSCSSIDSDDLDAKLKDCSVDDGGSSDSDCYVGPLELNHAMSKSYSEETKHGKPFKDNNLKNSDEYDYPYMQGVNRLFSNEKSPPSQHNYKNVPVSHNKVHIAKTTSVDSGSGVDCNTNVKKRKPPFSGQRSSSVQIARASSQGDMLESFAGGEDYVKMNPDESSLVKSHSFDDTTALTDARNYKSINRKSLETVGDSVYVSLSPDDKGSLYNGKPNTRHSAVVFDNAQNDKNLYLPILPPTADDLKKAESKIERKLMRSSTAHDMPAVRK